MKKIIVAGNPTYGVAGALKQLWPEANFFSRSANGFDLTKPEFQTELAKITLNYDVFINCSCLWNFHQSLLLSKVYEEWINAEHAGQIINFGSTVILGNTAVNRKYVIEKHALKRLSDNLSLACTYPNGAANKIRVTHLCVSGLKTPSMEKKYPDKELMDLGYVADVTNWLIAQPDSINVHELCITKI